MRKETGDWEPLPAEEQIAHPGEIGAKTAAIEPAAPADPRAGAALAALQRPLGPAPAAESFVAAAAARERQQQGREAAAALPHQADLAPVQSGLRAASDPPLPPAEREHVAGHPAQQRRERVERFWVAYVVFFFAGIPLLLVDGLAPFLTMAAGGFLTGLVWQLVPRDRFWSAASAVVVYAAVMVVPRAAMLLRHPFDAGVALFGGCLVGYLACLGAMSGEMRRNGGFP